MSSHSLTSFTLPWPEHIRRQSSAPILHPRTPNSTSYPLSCLPNPGYLQRSETVVEGTKAKRTKWYGERAEDKADEEANEVRRLHAETRRLRSIQYPDEQQQPLCNHHCSPHQCDLITGRQLYDQYQQLLTSSLLLRCLVDEEEEKEEQKQKEEEREMVFRGDIINVYICLSTGSIHQCTAERCTHRLRIPGGEEICELTGFVYDGHEFQYEDEWKRTNENIMNHRAIQELLIRDNVDETPTAIIPFKRRRLAARAAAVKEEEEEEEEEEQPTIRDNDAPAPPRVRVTAPVDEEVKRHRLAADEEEEDEQQRPDSTAPPPVRTAAELIVALDEDERKKRELPIDMETQEPDDGDTIVDDAVVDEGGYVQSKSTILAIEQRDNEDALLNAEIESYLSIIFHTFDIYRTSALLSARDTIKRHWHQVQARASSYPGKKVYTLAAHVLVVLLDMKNGCWDNGQTLVAICPFIAATLPADQDLKTLLTSVTVSSSASTRKSKDGKHKKQQQQQSNKSGHLRKDARQQLKTAHGNLKDHKKTFHRRLLTLPPRQ